MKSKLLIIIFALFLPFSYAQEEKPDTALSLEQLLELVQQGKFAESEEATERENRNLLGKEVAKQHYWQMQKQKDQGLRQLLQN